MINDKRCDTIQDNALQYATIYYNMLWYATIQYNKCHPEVFSTVSVFGHIFWFFFTNQVNWIKQVQRTVPALLIFCNLLKGFN